jgi:[ribosomal protein S5]-alanine N-acetyltransferase
MIVISRRMVPQKIMNYFLTSERLGFRCWTAADEPLAIGLWCDPQVTALIGGRWSADVARERLAEEMDQQNKHGVQYWPVFLLSNGEHVGCAGLRPHRLEEKIYEMGIHLRPPFWSHGLASEAAHTLIHFGFSEFGAAALFVGHHPHNMGSRQLVQKLGFAYQRDQLYLPTGLMHPTYLLTREMGMDAKSRSHESLEPKRADDSRQHQEKLKP